MIINLKIVLQHLRSFSRRHIRLLGGLCVCAILGVAAALMNSNAVLKQSNPGADWALPSDTPELLVSGVDTMLESPLFGAPPVIKTPVVVEKDETTLEDWQLLGIIIEGDQRQIILKNEATGEILHARTGDILPGGELLLEIRDNAINFERENENRSIALFRDIERQED